MSNPIKHITKNCPVKSCQAKAFVQVVVVEDAATQKKIDAKANKKLTAELNRLHKEGGHD